MSECDAVRGLLFAFDAPLDKEEHDLLQSHLASCAECRALHQQQLRLLAALQKLPQRTAPADVAGQVMTHLSPGLGAGRRRTVAVSVLAAAAAVSLLVIYGQWPATVSEPPTLAEAPAEDGFGAALKGRERLAVEEEESKAGENALRPGPVVRSASRLSAAENALELVQQNRGNIASIEAVDDARAELRQLLAFPWPADEQDSSAWKQQDRPYSQGAARQVRILIVEHEAAGAAGQAALPPAPDAENIQNGESRVALSMAGFDCFVLDTVESELKARLRQWNGKVLELDANDRRFPFVPSAQPVRGKAKKDSRTSAAVEYRWVIVVKKPH